MSARQSVIFNEKSFAGVKDDIIYAAVWSND